MIITRTTKFGHVEESRHHVSSSILIESENVAQVYDRVFKATEGLCLSLDIYSECRI